MKHLEDYIKHQFNIETKFNTILDSININNYASLVKISIKTIQNDVSLKEYFDKYIKGLKDICEKDFLSNYFYCTKAKSDWIKSETNKSPTKTYFKYILDSNDNVSFIPHSWKEYDCLNTEKKYQLEIMNEEDFELNMNLIQMYKKWFYLLTESTYHNFAILENIDVWIYEDMDFGFIEPIILTHRDTNKLVYRF